MALPSQEVFRALLQQDSPHPYQQRQDEQEQRLAVRREAVWEARDFLEAFVKERWAAHWGSISIECDRTLAELRGLVRTHGGDDGAGVRACRSLVRVPVINEEIAVALWERLCADTKTDPQALEEEKRRLQQLWEDAVEREATRKGKSRLRMHRHSNARERDSKPPQQQPKPQSICVYCRECDQKWTPLVLNAPHPHSAPVSTPVQAGFFHRLGKSRKGSSVRSIGNQPREAVVGEGKEEPVVENVPGQSTCPTPGSPDGTGSRKPSASTRASTRASLHEGILDWTGKPLAAFAKALSYGYGKNRRSAPRSLSSVSQQQCVQMW